jgi:hypothetical protein
VTAATARRFPNLNAVALPAFPSERDEDAGEPSPVFEPHFTVSAASPERLPSRRKKASQGNDVLRTFVSKRKIERSEREDRERRNYPPPPRRRIDAATQTPAERNLPTAASIIRRFFHV